MAFYIHTSITVEPLFTGNEPLPNLGWLTNQQAPVRQPNRLPIQSETVAPLLPPVGSEPVASEPSRRLCPL